MDALLYALSMLNVNVYAISDFEISVFDISLLGTGYSVALNDFEDIWPDDGY